MSVYNGAAALPRTLQSVLTQAGCTFEVIVVDDGSTDDSGRILDDWAARDARLRVIHQPNTGLTRALIRGCAEARGEFIVRQDCGDVSLPGRLAAQQALLRENPAVVMVACGTRFLGPEGEVLYEVVREGTRLGEGLSVLELNQIKGPPHHGGTMFRRDTYLAVGGYRPQFVVAQDIDLWLRLSECGQCLGQTEILYVASVEAGSISGRRRDEQFKLAGLALACARARRSGGGDQTLLDAFESRPVSRARKGPATGAERARFFYFLGASLRHRDRSAARRYFWHAVLEQPFHLKALWRCVWG